MKEWELDLLLLKKGKKKYFVYFHHPYFYEMDELTGESELLIDCGGEFVRGGNQRFLKTINGILSEHNLPCKVNNLKQAGFSNEIMFKIIDMCKKQNAKFKSPDSYLVYCENYQRLRREI